MITIYCRKHEKERIIQALTTMPECLFPQSHKRCAFNENMSCARCLMDKIQWRPNKPTLSAKVEAAISQILTVSMDDVSPNTLQMLENEPQQNNLGLSVYSFGDEMLMVDVNKKSNLGQVPDFQAIMKLAIKAGCKKIILDADASPVMAKTIKK